MIDRDEILATLEGYETSKAKIGVIASHSALDVCDGAQSEGLRTLAICQAGREKTFANYFRAVRESDGSLRRGMVDEVLVLDRFKQVMEIQRQKALIEDNVLFIPNRSFVSYCGIDAVEDDFTVPMVGSRNLLRSEDRGGEKDYYWLLEQAGMPYPRKITDPQDIEDLTIVKLHHKQKILERGFFTASSYTEYREKADELIRQGVIDQESLDGARMEEYIIGPVFNLDFFYSPLEDRGERIELLGIDWRFESSLDGYVRLPADQQLNLVESQVLPEYTVCGHNSATLRESLLERAFVLAEQFVDCTKRLYDPGMIGPFCLQTCVDKDMNFHIYDVAPRIGGGTNVHMAVGHPYANALWRREMSTGRRLAMEIRRAIEEGRLDEIVS